MLVFEALIIGYCVLSFVNKMIAPCCTSKLILLFNWIGPVNQTPGVTTTLPPPASTQAAIVFQMHLYLRFVHLQQLHIFQLRKTDWEILEL